MSNLQKFARNLQFAYQHCGLTQEQFAEKAGITEAHLCRIINLRVPNVSLKVCSQLADAAGVELSDLFDEPSQFMLKYGERVAA